MEFRWLASYTISNSNSSQWSSQTGITLNQMCTTLNQIPKISIQICVLSNQVHKVSSQGANSNFSQKDQIKFEIF